MQFSKLIIENFRSHARTELALERITAIRGINAVGKTSIEDALGILFAGRTMSTGTNGQGADRLIYQGEKKATVTLERGDSWKYQATLSPEGRKTRLKGEPLAQLTTINRDVWSCLCSTRYFGRLSPAEQRDMLASLVVPPGAPIPPEALEMLGPDGWVGSGDALRDIQQGYDIAFEKRTDINRRMRDWREPEKPSDQEVDVEKVREQLQERQQQLAEAKEQRQQMTATASQRTAKLKDIDEREQELTQFLSDQTRDQQTLQGRVLSDGAISNHRAVAKNAEKHAELLAQFTIDNAAEQNAAAALQAAEKLEDSGTKACPTCKQAITEAVLEAIYGPLIAARDAAAQKRQQTVNAIEQLGNVPVSVRAVAEHDQAAAQLKKVNSKVAEIQGKLEKIRLQRQELGSGTMETIDTTAIDAAIADLDNRIKRGLEIHAQASMAVQRRKDYDKAWAERREMDGEKALLERAVEVLGPKGVRVQLLSGYIGEFTARMNKILDGWGYRVELSLEPYSFRISRAGRMIDLDLLSESERLRFGIAFQVALAIHLAVGFVVIDQMDMLDQSSRKVLFNQLYQEERIEQAVLLLTDEKQEAPAAPGSVFYRLSLRDGKTIAEELVRTPDMVAA
jgi:DNA repair exonuclease SbcCD ATPase subunit